MTESGFYEETFYKAKAKRSGMLYCVRYQCLLHNSPCRNVFFHMSQSCIFHDWIIGSRYVPEDTLKKRINESLAFQD